MARKFMLNVTIDPDLVALFTAHAKARGCSRSELVNHALRCFADFMNPSIDKKNNKMPDNKKSVDDSSQMTLDQVLTTKPPKKHNIYYRTLDRGLEDGEGG